MASQSTTDNSRPPPTAAEIAAKQKANEEFRRVVQVAASVKAAAKNPDFFKLESAILTDDGTVCIAYRATNSFNAVVPGYASSREGKISTNAGDWNRWCARKSGIDYKHARQAL